MEIHSNSPKLYYGFELNESILKQLIEHLFHEYIFYYYFTLNQNMVVQ